MASRDEGTHDDLREEHENNRRHGEIVGLIVEQVRGDSIVESLDVVEWGRNVFLRVQEEIVQRSNWCQLHLVVGSIICS